MKKIKIALFAFLLIFLNLITTITVFAQIDPSCDPNISFDTSYLYGDICNNLANLEYCNYGCPNNYRCDFVVVDEPTLNRCYCHCYPDLGAITPTPPSGTNCCNSTHPCPPDSGLVCEGFSQECALSGYPMLPNLCVLDVIPTPIPGSGCNYTECRYDTDCDQVSSCRCLGYIAGIQRGLCYPSDTCGGFMQPCCDSGICSGSLVPVHIEMSTLDEDEPLIDVCFCFFGSSAPPAVVTPPMKCVPENQTEETGIDTAIGCVPVLTEDTNPFTRFILTWFIGLGGGIAFVLTVVAGAMITLAGGDPKKIVAGRELFVAALSGLLFLIFSVFMLRFLGVDILGIPGL